MTALINFILTKEDGAAIISLMSAICKCCRSHLTTLFAILSFPSLVLASGVVENNSQSALVAAMAGGGTVTFAFNGTIFLTNTLVVSNNTMLDATGQTVAISGNNSVQILVVNAGTTLSLSNLTFIDGLAQGVLSSNDFGNVYSYSVTAGCGGAISNAGTLEAFACTFTNNGAQGVPTFVNFVEDDPTDSTEGCGGAIYNTGNTTASGCVFAGNWTVGGDGTIPVPYTSGAAGSGGAFYNLNEASIINCVFSNNTATGGPGGDASVIMSDEQSGGGPGGVGYGGAICNNGSLIVSNNTFAHNSATGGDGNTGSQGVSGPDDGAPGFGGGAAGNAYGGALCCLAGTNTIVNCTFWSNSAVGGIGGMGGEGAKVQVGRYRGGNGGYGGQGGNGIGGAISDLGGLLLMTNITVASNTVTAGAGGAGGAGYSIGYPDIPGSPGPNGSPGTNMGSAIGNVGGTNVLKNSILSPNFSTDTNIFGSFVDAGNNISFDGQTSLTNSTSFNGANPLLAPLANYGGPTPTMALLTGSPAIDAADSSAFPAMDQRGFPRPYGSAPDIGAFEYPPMNTLIIGADTNGLLHLAYAGTNGQTFRIFASVNLVQWTPISTNTLGGSDYLDSVFPTTNVPGQFFSAVSP